jgi:hypothetical protein
LLDRKAVIPPRHCGGGQRWRPSTVRMLLCWWSWRRIT